MAPSTRSAVKYRSISLLHIATGERVPAQLYSEICQEDLQNIATAWSKEFDLRSQRAKACDDSTWRDEDDHWDWQTKQAKRQGALSHQGYSVVADDVTQGVMYVATDGKSRLKSGSHAVYVDYLAAAPWNRPLSFDATYERKIRGVGEALMREAVALSLDDDLGTDGRVCLHALPDAEAFYHKRIGMQDLGRDHEYSNLRYFEMSRDESLTFLAKFG